MTVWPYVSIRLNRICTAIALILLLCLGITCAKRTRWDAYMFREKVSQLRPARISESDPSIGRYSFVDSSYSICSRIDSISTSLLERVSKHYAELPKSAAFRLGGDDYHFRYFPADSASELKYLVSRVVSDTGVIEGVVRIKLSSRAACRVPYAVLCGFFNRSRFTRGGPGGDDSRKYLVLQLKGDSLLGIGSLDL